MHFNSMQDNLLDEGAVVDKLNLSMHSKPSGANSGRITPPSYTSSNKRMTMVAGEKTSGSRKTGGENEGTGSVAMSND